MKLNELKKGTKVTWQDGGDLHKGELLYLVTDTEVTVCCLDDNKVIRVPFEILEKNETKNF